MIEHISTTPAAVSAPTIDRSARATVEVSDAMAITVIHYAVCGEEVE